MAFHNHLNKELKHEIPVTVEIATDNNLIEGVLIGVEDNSTIRVIETKPGYAPLYQNVLIPIASINFIRIMV